MYFKGSLILWIKGKVIVIV